MSFDDWYVTKITTYVFSSKADENLAREAYNAGMERAAEIITKLGKGRIYLDAIRKEIEK